MADKPANEKEREKAGKLGYLKSNAWTDLALTLPIFVGYHIGVVLLDVRNAADLVTSQLVALAAHDVLVYWGLTLAIGAAMVAILWVLGRGEAFEPSRFGLVALEGVVYAALMTVAAVYVVGSLHLGGGPLAVPSRGAKLVMSLGAGFYEEVAFRVGLFGLGALAIRAFFGGVLKLGMTLGWALVAAAVFSGWHYVGALGDPFELRSFVFRWVCGAAFTAIFVFRGFAPAVWTHALYDIWALGVLSLS